MGTAYSRLNQSFVCNFLSTPRYKSQVSAKETKCFSCFVRDFRDMMAPIHAIILVIPRYFVD